MMYPGLDPRYLELYAEFNREGQRLDQQFRATRPHLRGEEDDVWTDEDYEAGNAFFAEFDQRRSRELAAMRKKILAEYEARGDTL